MASPYQDFVKKAKERFLERQHRKASNTGAYQFTLHSQYKMRQYGLSKQRVRSVIRHPKRREVGIVAETVAVMQPVSPKKIVGEKGRPINEIWKQEIWVMFIIKNQKTRVISAWRYPGVSPKRNPIPPEILRELEEGSILEAEAGNLL